MAITLPTFADVGINDPRSVGSLPTYPANDAVAEGTAALGKGIDKVGGAIADYAAEQRRNRNAVNAALATADLEGNLIRDKELLANETDPGKIDTIRGRLRGYLDRAGKTITDPEHRELWAAQHSVKVAQTEAVADARQTKIYEDKFLAGASAQLTDLSRLAAQASNPEDREEAKRRIGEVVGSLERAGVVGSTKAGELMRSYGEDIITGHAQWLDANGKPGEGLAFTMENARHLDPKKLDALTNHLRPRADKDAGASLADRALAGGAAPQSGAHAQDAVAVFREAGWSDAAIQGALHNAAAEGGFDTNWLPGDGGTSFGHWQYHRGGELEGYQRFAGGDKSTATQARYLVQRMEEIRPGFGKIADPKQATDIIEAEFERPKNVTGSRYRGPIALGDGAADASAAPGLLAPPENATAYAEQLHQAQAKRYAPPGPPDWRAAADRIEASGASREVKDQAIAALKHKQGNYELGQSQAGSDLTLAVARGEAGREQIESAYQQSKISPAVRTHLQQLLDKQDAEKQAQAEAVLKVSGAGNGGAPLDPKSDYDKKALNFHYSVTAKTWPADQALDRSLAYATQYGMVPDPLKAMVRGGLHSGRPDQAVVAADAVNRLRNANPQLIGDLGDESDLRLATLIQANTQKGMPPEIAVKSAVEGLKVDKTAREAREADFDTLRGKHDVDRQAADKQWIAGKQNSIWTVDPTVDPVMRAEFEALSKQEFVATGDLEAARTRALDTVNRVWGRTRVASSGNIRYMRLAPEKFYGIATMSPDKTSDWMNEQLLGEVTKGAVIDPSNPITLSRLLIVPSEKTAPDGRPAYEVMLNGTYGYERVFRWMPNWETSPEHQRQTEKRARTLDELRDRRLNPPPPLDFLLRGGATLQEQISRGSGEQ